MATQTRRLDDYIHRRARRLEEKKQAGAAAREPGGGELSEGIRLLFTLPIMMCFWFFIFVTLGFTGVRAFFVAAMDILYGMPLGLLNTALTGFLLGSALGILAGGVLADRIGPRIVTATVTLVSAGALIVLVGSMSLPLAAYVATLVVEPDEDARPAHERLARRTKHPRIGIEIR